MKTERRHELQTNELAQQIDQISTYARQNANRLIIFGVAVLVVIIALYWVVKGRQARIMDGWATLSDSSLMADPASAVERFRSVAQDSSDPRLTVSAWLRVGETAMSQIIAGDAKKSDASSAPAPTTSIDEWKKTAQEAFENVVRLAGSRDSTAKGEALMMLGVLAEDRGEFEKAREYYTRIRDEQQFAMTPLPAQAEFRLKGMAEWSRPITFPPAAITVPAPETAAQTDPTAGQKLITSQTIDVRTGKVVAGDTDTPIRVETVAAPTTQPAGSQ